MTDFGGFVGNLPGSQGTATVSGVGSTWTNTDIIQVGGLGGGFKRSSQHLDRGSCDEHSKTAAR